MPYSPHTLFSFGGRLMATTGQPEIWTCGVRACGSTAGGIVSGVVPENLNVCNSWGPALATWWHSSAAHMPDVAYLDWVKVNDIDADGHYANPVTYVYDLPTPVNGTAVATCPEIISTVVSWQTAAARGPGHAGRIYLPNFALEIAGPGSMYLSDAGRAVALSQGVEIFGSIVAAGGANDVECAPVVASKVNGLCRSITAVRVGNRLDSQRRRSNAIPEVYISQVVSAEG